jgi:hypothetical protein
MTSIPGLTSKLGADKRYDVEAEDEGLGDGCSEPCSRGGVQGGGQVEAGELNAAPGFRDEAEVRRRNWQAQGSARIPPRGSAFVCGFLCRG